MAKLSYFVIGFYSGLDICFEYAGQWHILQMTIGNDGRVAPKLVMSETLEIVKTRELTCRIAYVTQDTKQSVSWFVSLVFFFDEFSEDVV
jgi:hypothetical protein